MTWSILIELKTLNLNLLKLSKQLLDAEEFHLQMTVPGFKVRKKEEPQNGNQEKSNAQEKDHAAKT